MPGQKTHAKDIARLVIAELGRFGTDAKALYTVEESAQFLACSANQVRKFVASGKLRPVNLDARQRFRRQDLEALIVSCQVEATS